MMKKGLKFFGRILSWIVIFVLIVAIAGVFIPQIMGMKMYAVLTGSMIPTFGVGELIYVAPAEFQDIQIDDCITYYIDEQETIVTHRVVKIDQENKAFYTKGDNNAEADRVPVPYKDVIGVVKFSVPKLGCIVQPLGTLYGKVAVICGILACVILMNLAAYRKRSRKLQDGESEN